jgi:hypothetical protein
MAALAFLLECEGIVDRYLRQAWGERYEDWPAELATVFEESGIEPLSVDRMNSDKWTLGAMYHAALDSAKVDSVLASIRQEGEARAAVG